MSHFKAALFATVFAASPALAQESAVSSAADAFGERVGVEQLGLYSEGQVRGFDLQSSGAYRIEDAYFARAAPLNDPVLAGVGVRVGVAAARLAYPAPSGVVNYRLREPDARNRLTLGGGLRDYGTPTLEANGSWSDATGRLGLAGGVIWRPRVEWASGAHGSAIDAGLVGRWRISEAQTLRAFFSVYDRAYNGDYAMTAADPVEPPPPRRGHNYSPDWARVEAANTNMGVLYRAAAGGWALDLSAFRSIWNAEETDFTLVDVDRDGDAVATTFVSPGKTNVSDSAEARATRTFATGPLNHLVSASVRWRRSEVDLASSLAVRSAPFHLDDGPRPGVRPQWSGARGLDAVEQTTASLGYGLVWADRLQLRLGAHRTRYEKSVRTLAGSTEQGREETTLWNASAVWSLTPRTSLFASWVTGLEETGSAPSTATNRNEVLPPVEAEQYEFGVRHALGERLTLIGAVFDVSKPTTGLRADGSFGLVGEVTHRGVEASLAGRLDGRTNVVMGAVFLDPKVSGPLVESGAISDRPAGLSDVIANASIERQLAGGWSVDAQVTWNGPRWVDAQQTFRLDGVTELSLGARRRFEIAGRPASFRILGSNLARPTGYWASPTTELWPIAGPTVRATLNVTFGG
ncbi:TonB-dependent siderophore receptor [Phenylobacterium sp.]|uniref:TonB-dependent siderophore receptor n=1 Tax=Phenylobacterium sp. TaxID=1871053 RepID=UPI002B95351F|nr:TonB-dependent receptor [Phenylobacterium sp.]HVI33982.1 TonB-dependent receptor [Phenylobacterium sp.]